MTSKTKKIITYHHKDLPNALDLRARMKERSDRHVQSKLKEYVDKIVPLVLRASSTGNHSMDTKVSKDMIKHVQKVFTDMSYSTVSKPYGEGDTESVDYELLTISW